MYRACRVILRILALSSILGPIPTFAAEPVPEPVSVRTADGFRVFGDYYEPAAGPHPAPFVILLHMYGHDRTSWRPLIEPLHEAGFGVLALDLRGHGQSATTETAERVKARDGEIFREMQEDVRAAYSFMATKSELDRARFAIVGASVGCSIALQYAVADKSVDAIVCLSPGLDYLGLDSAADIRQVQGRKILLIAAETERAAPQTLEKATDGVSASIFKGEAHGTDLIAGESRALAETVSFLQKHIGTPSSAVVVGSINSTVFHAPDSEWVKEISPANLRVYSSAREAESRGLRPSRSSGPNDRKERGRR